MELMVEPEHRVSSLRSCGFQQLLGIMEDDKENQILCWPQAKPHYREHSLDDFSQPLSQLFPSYSMLSHCVSPTFPSTSKSRSLSLCSPLETTLVLAGLVERQMWPQSTACPWDLAAWPWVNYMRLLDITRTYSGAVTKIIWVTYTKYSGPCLVFLAFMRYSKRTVVLKVIYI